MPFLSRQFDTNSMGGLILRGAKNVLVGGRPVGLHPSTITEHRPFKPTTKHIPHAIVATTTSAKTVMCEGSPVLMVGSLNTCLHSIISGDPKVMVQ